MTNLERSANTLIGWLMEKNFACNMMYNRSLLDHLVSTYELAKQYGCLDCVCLAALAHSVYGFNKPYNFNGIDMSDRKIISNIIGIQSENIAFLFYQSEYNGSILKNINLTNNYFIFSSLNGSKIFVDKPEIVNLFNLSAVNMLEQMVYLFNNKFAKGIDLLKHLEPYQDANRFLLNKIHQDILHYINLMRNE